ncbi:vitamin B12 dependent-methionine synthase activation domain-containing protein [Candidatus Neomarinimicrobiota bacterium]
MRHLLEFNLEDILPEGEAVLQHQGMPPGKTVPGHIQAILEEAVEVFTSEARPTGILQELTVEQFDAIFRGEGLNEHEAVLKAIYPQAESLALFALTMGSTLSANIEEQFAGKNFALGAMLDAVASLAADGAAAHVEERYEKDLAGRNNRATELRVLGYSPGYCGWHISAQKKLFQALEPERIGITLNTSYLMTPLKSVSGVLVAGPREIHLFKPSFDFCKVCKSYSCHERLRDLKAAVA